LEPKNISYLYVVKDQVRTLVGVVDLRELALAADHLTIADIMTSPVVTAEENDIQEDLVVMFEKYHYRMIPVVDRDDRVLGIIHYNDVMKGVE